VCTSLRRNHHLKLEIYEIRDNHIILAGRINVLKAARQGMNTERNKKKNQGR
jgi:chemotaxis response regulator CheB